VHSFSPLFLARISVTETEDTLCRMSTEAVEVLQTFYLQLRDHSHGADGTPITARQLESLVRLAEARARIELREEITKQDAMVRAATFSRAGIDVPACPKSREPSSK
jgi:DNA replicative helicase MCM subunit Mcm2 (Cdc46/Mcm family)